MEDILAKSVSEKIQYVMLKEYLIKPLPPVMVTKEFKVPVTKDKKNDDGIEVNEYDQVATETKEVESVFTKGVVLKVPVDYTNNNFNVGDIVVYNKRFCAEFDLFKNSVLVKPYDIVAVVANEDTKEEE